MSRWFVPVVLIALVGCKKKEPEAPMPEPAPAAEPAPAPAPAPAEPEMSEADYGPVVDPVMFETGGTTIAAGQMGAIDKAAEVAKSSDWSILVVGLADASGDPAANKAISEQRANAVADELKKRVPGIESRIQAVGIGERLATGATQSERKVEFVFYKDKGLPPRQVVIKSGVLEEDFRARRAARQSGEMPPK